MGSPDSFVPLRVTSIRLEAYPIKMGDWSVDSYNIEAVPL